MNAATVLALLLGLAVGVYFAQRSRDREVREMDTACRSNLSHARILSASLQEARAEIQLLRAENTHMLATRQPRVLHGLTIRLGTVRLLGCTMSRN